MKLLENKAVQLIPMESAHTEGIYEAAQDKRIWEHMSVELLTKESVEQYIQDAQKKRAAGTDFAYVIVDRPSTKIVGATWLLDMSMQHKRAEIGSTWLNPESWRTPINTNCKFLLMEYCFEELGLQRVQLKTGHENVRSQRAIERLGAVKEGILRSHMIRKEGTVRHTVMYSVTGEEWPQVRERFQKVLVK